MLYILYCLDMKKGCAGILIHPLIIFSVSIIMLLGKVVLCSPANEYYAHWLTSIMLTD